MHYRIFSNSTCPLLNISNIGYSSGIAVTRFGPGVRNFYIIHFIISGKGYFNGNQISVGQGFLITPGMQEHYFPDENDPWEFLWIMSDDPVMSELFLLFHADNHSNIFCYDYVYAVKEVSSFLIANKESFYDAFEMLEIFLKIFKYQQKKSLANTTKSNADVYIEAAEKYISSNIHHPITIRELTAFLGVSQPYLFRIFKDRFSKSPKQYILDKKISYAQKLLKETDMSITYIAYSVGFQDVLSFSKCFRLKTGISPQNYRHPKRK